MARIYQRKKLREGDYVEVLHVDSQSDFSFLIGTRGVVKACGTAGAYAIQFDRKHRDLQSCDGHCLPSRGLWLGRAQLKIVSRQPVYYPSDQARYVARRRAFIAHHGVHNADEREALGRRGRVGTDPASQARARYRNTRRTLQIHDTTAADAGLAARAAVTFSMRAARAEQDRERKRDKRSRKKAGILNDEGFGVIGEL